MIVRVSIRETGNPKLMTNVYACSMYPCKHPPPPCSIEPLHFESTVRDPYPTSPSQVAVLPYPNLKQKTRMYRLAI